MTQALTPDQSWVVGVQDVPEWLAEITDFAAFLDEHGNAYFQFSNTAVLVPKGETVEKRGDRIVFGNHWLLLEDGKVKQDGYYGYLFIPEELPEP